MADEPVLVEEQNGVSPDEARLEGNQRIRHDIINYLITDSKGVQSIPMDMDTLNVVKGLLKDSDSSVFTKKRLNVDELGAENDKRAAELLDRVMSRVPKVDRNAVRDTRGPDLNRGQLPSFELTEGETSQVGDTVDLDQIISNGRAVLKGITED